MLKVIIKIINLLHLFMWGSVHDMQIKKVEL